MMLTSIALLVAGLIVLVAGAEAFVRGASRLAAMIGISPLVIGLTIVAIGTSSPEIAVSVQAALSGQADIALGNVVGSNIANVALILGLSALIAPLVVAQQLIRLDVPIMIGASLLLLVLGLNGTLSRLDSVLFLAIGLVYTGFLIRQSRTESRAIQEEYAQEFGLPPTAERHGWSINTGLIVGGLVLLILGSRWFVAGATDIASAFGISQLVIGLTVVAVGTSLPEVATSVVATMRGERDIAVGNVVGSNIFNILFVLGIAGTVAPGGIGVSLGALQLDIPVMIALAVACLPIFFTGNLIARWEGVVFVGYYAAYATYLFLHATHSGALPLFAQVVAAFVIPLTIVTLLIVTVREIRSRRNDGAAKDS